jgi:hypothetical protein
MRQMSSVREERAKPKILALAAASQERVVSVSLTKAPDESAKAEKMASEPLIVKPLIMPTEGSMAVRQSHAELQAQEMTCSRKRVARLMRELDPAARRPR